MRKKILFFLYSLSGGGAERTTINIINNLNKKKYDVVLVLGTNNNNDYSNHLNENIRIVSLKCSRLRYSIFKLRKCILKENPDLIFSTINSNNIAVLLSKLLTLKETPVIVREASNRTQAGSVTMINKILTRFFYNYVASKVIALSYGVKDDLIKNFRILKEKVDVIYNPVEVKNIINNSNEVIIDFKKKEKEKLIISVGRLVDQKAQDILLKAFLEILKEENAYLIILGKGPKEKELKQLCHDLGISNKVEFLGFKSNPYKYIKLSDLFILSSHCEGFAHVIVEAMTLGIPVVSTDCNSGPGEIIENDVNGILVPVSNYHLLAKESLKLLSDPDKSKRIKEGGVKRSLDFKAGKIITQYEATFNRVLK